VGSKACSETTSVRPLPTGHRARGSLKTQRLGAHGEALCGELGASGGGDRLGVCGETLWQSWDGAHSVDPQQGRAGELPQFEGARGGVLRWGGGTQRTGIGRAHGTAEHMGRGRNMGDKRKGGSSKGVPGTEYTVGLASPKDAGQGSPVNRWECWAGERRGEGVGRMGTFKPADTPSPPQVRSPTIAPGKAVAGNLPAPMS